MSIISDLTPCTLTVDEVGKASTAFAHAARCNFIGMHRVVQQLRPAVAEELFLSVEILKATLAHRAWGRGRPTPQLVALAALTPDDDRLDGGAR